jgi:hypothetical protein
VDRPKIIMAGCVAAAILVYGILWWTGRVGTEDLLEPGQIAHDRDGRRCAYTSCDRRSVGSWKVRIAQGTGAQGRTQIHYYREWEGRFCAPHGDCARRGLWPSPHGYVYVRDAVATLVIGLIAGGVVIHRLESKQGSPAPGTPP